MKFRAKHEGAANNPASSDGSDPELDRLIEIGKSRQVPELLGGADADFTVAGADGLRMRFEGQGTPEGDEILLQAVGNAVKAIDAKRER